MALPYPLLVADLHDEASVQKLLALARAGGEAWVPLLASPTKAGPHVLELVHPASAEKHLVLATPLGERGPRGVPLRLAPLPADAGVPSSDREPSARSYVDLGELPVEVASSSSDAGALEGRVLGGGAFTLGSLVERAPTHSIHHAKDRRGRGHVVVRVASAELAADGAFRARFLGEAEAAAALTHPNLVRVLATGVEPDGLLWAASEQPIGQTLRERLTAEGPLPAAKLVPLALQVCEALGAAHAAGLVHRDVRPDNVVLAVELDRAALPRVVAKVREIGFGLGRRLATGRVAASAPEYMSPEQCRGTEDLDARSDVYAFGILLYELVTGRVPFTSDKPIVVVNQQLSMAPQPPSWLRPGIDPRLDTLVLRALEKRREERHDGMEALAAELRALLSAAPKAPAVAVALPAVSLPPPAPPSNRVLPSIPPAPASSARALPAPSSPSPSPSSPSPSPSPSSPEPERPSRRPAWLVDAGTGHADFLQNLATGAPTAPIEDVTALVRRDPRAYAARVVAHEDPRSFLEELRAFQAALPALVAAADARALWAVSSALAGVATEKDRSAGTGSRAAIASRALAWFHDPKLLGPVADRRLESGDPAAHTLLVRAGARGAHALYGARVKRATEPAVRAPFVETLRAIGAAAWPVAKAALERMPRTVHEGRNAAGVMLAEDLLASLPPLPDVEGLEAVLRPYLRADVPSLAEAAARLLARSQPTIAGPALVLLLDDPREGIRLAAITGLREMGAVDADVVAKLAPIVRREVPATPALRLAAIAALRAVVEGARSVAAPLLVALVRKSPRGEDRIVLAAAEALLSMLGNQARAVVLDCQDRSEEPLRSELAALLANPVLELELDRGQGR